MNLRSRSSDPSNNSKGKNIMEISSSSEEDDDVYLSSDSDFGSFSVEDLDNGEQKDIGYVSDSEVDEPTIKKSVTEKRKTKVNKMVVQMDENPVVGVDYVEPYEEAVYKMRAYKKHKPDKPILLWEVWEEETKKWLDRHERKGDVDLDTLNEVVTETVDTPSDLTMPLLRYQTEWLAWGLRQEESDSKGGILADEMGMGKTVQAIALVLAKRELQRELGEPVWLSTDTSTGLPCVKATLVVCPLVAVRQWISEIYRFTKEGSIKVLEYHGPKRAKKISEFFDYDFIITTYSVVESEFRKVMPPKDRCEYCGKMFHAKKLKFHLKYFCGPDAKRTVKQSKQNKKNGKLDLNLSLSKDDISDDENDKKKASKKTTKRPRKKQQVETGGSSDIPSGSGYKSSLKSILHSVKWDRIILDEAHYIKDRRCNTTRAVFALESSYKWALSGTPLQNRVGELYSLVRFLQITPYSYYMCKDCDCRVLDYSPDSSCSNCPHKSVRHFCWWNRNIANPIAKSGRSSDGRRAMILLKDRVLKSILLRRTKKGRAADLALPPRIISLRRDCLDIIEQDYYTSLYTESQAKFNTYIDAGTVMNNYAHIFDLLTRLRQAVDHPYLVAYSKTAVDRRTDEANEPFCGLCHDVAEDFVVTSCEHLFCKACLIDYGQATCPTCDKPLTVDFNANKNQQDQKPKTSFKGFKSSSIINRICLENFQTSTKIDALKEEIRFMVERDGSAKGIVFSQFTSFLDLIHYSLLKSGVKCVMLDGSMSISARESAINRFTDDGECKIFLMSLKAGGVALNLTVASHVFLMDPWWNPAVEQQAQDRIHRIGQYKPIRVMRFVIENTIEERILNLQEKKRLVFEGTVGGSKEALGKLTEADMRFLFAT
uniref:DNA repair protein RAD16 n=1 Tax=Erigeron canadensis TaxID=72917 RepID=UPI001CB981CD|nr:DNA repair protein RAD16 [Erigeron canadensis]